MELEQAPERIDGQVEPTAESAGPAVQTPEQPQEPVQAKPLPPWEEVSDHFKKAFPLLDPKMLESRYAQTRSLQEARAYHASPETKSEEAGNYWMRSIDPMQSVKSSMENIAYKEARQRFDAGKAVGNDYNTIAGFEQRKETDANRGTVENIAGDIASIPGTVAKSALPWGLARIAAEQTLQAATAKAAEGPNNGEFYEPHNILPAAGIAGAQALLFNSLGKWGSGIKNAGARFAAKVGIGVGEWEALKTAGAGLDEVLPDAWKTRTDYGLIGHIAQGKYGDALKDAVTEVLTVGAFVGLSGNKRRLDTEGIQESLRQSKKRGDGPQEAADNLRQDMMNNAYDTLGLKPGASAEEVEAAYRAAVKKTHPDVGGSAEEFNRVQRAREYLKSQMERVQPKEQAQRPPEPPPEAPVRPEAQPTTPPTQAEVVPQAPGELPAPAVRGQSPEVAPRPDVIPMAGEGQRQLPPPVVEQAQKAPEPVPPEAPVKKPGAAIEPSAEPNLADLAEDHLGAMMEDIYSGPYSPEEQGKARSAWQVIRAAAARSGGSLADVMDPDWMAKRGPSSQAGVEQAAKTIADLHKTLQARWGGWEPGKETPGQDPSIEQKPQRAQLEKPSLLDRMKAKGKQDVATPVQEAEAPRAIRSFADYTPPDEYSKAGLTKDEAYIHEQLLVHGRSLRDVASDTVLKMGSYEGVRKAQLRAAGKMGDVNPETGQPLSAADLLRKRYVERARTGQTDSSDLEGAIEEHSHRAVAEAAAQGYALDLATARKEVKAQSRDWAIAEDAYQNSWKKFFEKAVKDGREFTPTEYAELDGKAARGERPPVAKGKSVEQAPVRSQSERGLQPGVAQRPEAAPQETAGQQGRPPADAGGSEAAGHELIPKATKEMLAEIASSGNKYLLEGHVKRELTDMYGYEAANEAIKEAKKTPRSETPTGYEGIKSVGRGRTAQSNADVMRGGIRDAFQRHAAGEEYENAYTQAQRAGRSAAKAEELLGQVRSENQELGKAEGIEQVAQATGHDPGELERLLDADDRAERDAIANDSGPTSGPEPGGVPFRREPGVNEPITGPADLGRGRSLTDHVKDVAAEFLRDDGAAVNLDTLKEKMAWVASAAHYTGNAVRRLAGQMFPDTTELNRVVGERMAEWANAEYHAIEQGEWYGNEVVGYKEGSRGSVRLGAVLTEMRLEAIKDFYAKEATRTSNEAYNARQRAAQATNPADKAKALSEAADFARQATDAMNARLKVNSVVGMFGSPFSTRQEYLAAKQSPVVQQQLKDWSRKLSPVLDDNYRETQGLGPLDPIQVDTQIPGLTVNLYQLEEGDKPSPTMASQGNPKNLRMRKNPFATKATGAAEAYELDAHKIIQNSFKKGTPLAARAQYYRAATDMRVGEFAPRGTKMEGKTEFIDASPPLGTQDAGAKDKSFFIDSKAAGELRTMLDIDKHNAFTKIASVLSQIPTLGALSSFAEVATHSANLGTGLFAPGMIRTFKGAVDIAKTEWQQLARNHDFMREVMDLAEIGATKSRGSEAGTIGSGLRKLSNAFIDKELPPAHFDKFWDPTYWSGKAIHHFDKLMRVSLSHAYKRIAAAEGLTPTKTGERDFINQWLGMYNRKAQNCVVGWLRASGFGPFATAATGQTVGAVRSVLGSPRISGLKATSQFKLRLGFLAKVVGTMMGGVFAYNLARWGRIDGDDDTPFGHIKLDPGPDGKKRTFDVMRFTGVTRGLRAIGGLAVIEGLRRGQSAGTIADHAILDIAHTLAHPFTGPLTSFGYTALTGKDTMGKQIAPKVSTATTAKGMAKSSREGKPEPGSSQMLLNLKAAAENINQPYATLFGKDRKNDVTAEETISKLASPFGIKYREVKKKR